MGVSFTLYPVARGTEWTTLFPPDMVDVVCSHETDDEMIVHCVGRSSALDYFFLRLEYERPMMHAGVALRVKNITSHGYGIDRQFSCLFVESSDSAREISLLIPQANLRTQSHVYVYQTPLAVGVALEDRLEALTLYRFFSSCGLRVWLDTPVRAWMGGPPRQSSAHSSADLPPPVPAQAFLSRSIEPARTRVRPPTSLGQGKNAKKRNMRHAEQSFPQARLPRTPRIRKIV